MVDSDDFLRRQDAGPSRTGASFCWDRGSILGSPAVGVVVPGHQVPADTLSPDTE